MSNENGGNDGGDDVYDVYGNQGTPFISLLL
jgi:hypothetical protein